MLIRGVEVAGRRGPVDVRIAEGVIVEIGPGLGGPDGVDGRGGALLPGLHDHHIDRKSVV